MSGVEIAVLSYHGWEIDPGLLAADVAALRASGWTELSLDGLRALLGGGRAAGRRYFHVTIDDGSERDAACVDALRAMSCPSTLFISLDAMSPAARDTARRLASCPDVSLQDHSLGHRRSFHYRHVVGFHSEQRPLMSSPSRNGLRPGDPVCMYGGELARPRFVPDPAAVDLCRAVAADAAEAPGTARWSELLSARLVDAGLAWRRLGRLCIAGSYESAAAFRARLDAYLADGRERLAAFAGRQPDAFAHPWWQPSAAADDSLRRLGYSLTFSGRGLCRRAAPFAVPRLYVRNDTPRPLNPEALARSDAAQRPAGWSVLRRAGRRVVFA